MTGNVYILSTYYMTDTDSFCTLFHSAPQNPEEGVVVHILQMRKQV